MARLEYVDIMRGGGILLVVIGHIIQFNNAPLDNPIFEFIYSFHMPLFFFISGYIAQKTVHINNGSQLCNFIFKKARTLLIPFFVWQLFANKYFLREDWISVSEIDPLYVWNNPGLWFLKDLFLIFIYYAFYNVIIENRKNRNILLFEVLALFVSFSVFVVMSIAGITSFNKIIFIYPFIIGHFISKYAILEKVFTGEKAFAMIFFAFFILVCHWHSIGDIYDDILKMIISTFASLMFLKLAQVIKFNEYLRNRLIRYGNKSLTIYIIQFSFTRNITGVDCLLTINPFLAFVIYSVLAIVICEMCCWVDTIISQSKYTRLILLGKK